VAAAAFSALLRGWLEADREHCLEALWGDSGKFEDSASRALGLEVPQRAIDRIASAARWKQRLQHGAVEPEVMRAVSCSTCAAILATVSPK
jgi:hypothetical protein